MTYRKYPSANFEPFSLVLPLIFSLFSLICLQAQEMPQNFLSGMQARSIGPAGMSGRVTAIDVVRTNADVWYIGTATGGVWRTVNGGNTFDPIFDEQPVLSIGSIAICQSDPKIIYVGTGEGNPRNSVSSGQGIYKSYDGGDTWEHLGLARSKNIHRIIVHPDDPDQIWVGVTGPPFGRTEERGVYKTSDGGQNWRRVLFTNDQSGIADLVIDPSNPSRLFAAMWQHRRHPWSFDSGGPGSGLYLSEDGGDNWRSLGEQHGLPPKPWGRIGLAIAPSNPETMLAWVESRKNALYKSIDGGYSWGMINDETIGGRPFYFAEIHIDPLDENRVYNLYSRLAMSENGGREFEVIEDWGRKVHADHQAMWIHPQDPKFIILGTDGGLYWTRDQTLHWNFADDLPVAQFYHVTVDMEMPYNVYGGMQDNGTWYGPAYTWRRAGLRNDYWQELGFNDGFDVVLEPSDPQIIYALWQGGMLMRVNKRTGQRKTIRPAPTAVPLRFNWNAAIAHDPFRENTIYIGSQFVHKSIDRGESWLVISPDLTTNDVDKQQQINSGGLTIDATAAENHTTITAIAPSPLQEGLIWVGTDDGKVQLTKNRGKRWKDLTAAIDGFPDGGWVNQIHPSWSNVEGAFVVVDNHRNNDDQTYVFRTENGGASWDRMSMPMDIKGHALSFLQDREVPDLYFLGTEYGLYYSLDRGQHWHKWLNGLPSAAISDMVIHPREHDLVIGTFGRSIYVLDDITPLRILATDYKSIQEQGMILFDPPSARLAIMQQATGQRLSPDGIYSGENRPFGAMISFWVDGSVHSRSVWMEIIKDDKVIYNERIPVSKGVNRAFWDLQMQGKSVYGPLMDPNLEQPWVTPGEYDVKLTYGTLVSKGSVTVLPDPNIRYDPKAVEASQKFRQRLEKLVKEKNRFESALSNKIRRMERRIERDPEVMAELLEVSKSLLSLISPQVEQGVISGSDRIGPAIDKAFFYAHSPYEYPSKNDYLLIEQLEKRWLEVRFEIKKYYDDL